MTELEGPSVTASCLYWCSLTEEAGSPCSHEWFLKIGPEPHSVSIPSLRCSYNKLVRQNSLLLRGLELSSVDKASWEILLHNHTFLLRIYRYFANETGYNNRFQSNLIQLAFGMNCIEAIWNKAHVCIICSFQVDCIVMATGFWFSFTTWNGEKKRSQLETTWALQMKIKSILCTVTSCLSMDIF